MLSKVQFTQLFKTHRDDVS